MNKFLNWLDEHPRWGITLITITIPLWLGPFLLVSIAVPMYYLITERQSLR